MQSLRECYDAEVRRRVQAVFFAAALALGATAALAQPSAAVELVWRAPPDAECPTEQAMLAEIARILGPAQGPQKSVSANGAVERVPAGWRGTLTLQTEETRSTRTFTGGTCREAAAATALIIALAVDARARPPASAPFSVPVSEPPDAAPSAPPGAPSAVTAPATSALTLPSGSDLASSVGRSAARPVHIAGLVSAAVDVGTLPAAAVGADLGIALSVARLRFELGAGYYAPQSTTLPDRSAEGGDFTLFAVSARGCYLAELGAIELGPCAAGRFLRVGAAAFGTAAAFDRAVTWGALGAEVLASWHVTKRLALDLRLGGLAPLRRPSFVVSSATTGTELPVHRPASLTFVGLLGGEVRFF